MCPQLQLWGVWRCWYRLGFSLAANQPVIWEPKLAWNARVDLTCSSKCMSLYPKGEWDAIMLGEVNHFDLCSLKPGWSVLNLMEVPPPFKPVSPFWPNKELIWWSRVPRPPQDILWFYPRNTVHQLDQASNPPALCGEVGSSLHSSHSRLFPRLFPPELYIPIPLAAVTPQSHPCELPSPPVCPRCCNYHMGGRWFSTESWFKSSQACMWVYLF